MNSRSLFAVACLTLLAACAEESVPPPPPVEIAPSVSVADASEQAIEAALAAFDVERYAERIQTLASDEFGGRAPFTRGETLTLDYLESQFREMGIGPGNGDSYRQPVGLVELTASPSADMKIVAGGEAWSLAYGEDVVSWTKRVVETSGLENSELVFVGYGIVAPEYDWNDYAGLDLEGKTAVILVNDPGFATGDNALFNGRAMTYYGRWTYKFEEAARQGAAGAIIVHQTDAAGYPWEVVTGSWTGPQFDLSAANDNLDRVALEGWISEAAAERLFAAQGLAFEDAAARAARSGFEPVTLGATASTTLKNTIRRADSANIVARIPGRERPDEHVIYMAHWDHLGSIFSGPDRVYNGAVDNATGTAALLELASAFAALPEAPERSVLFLAVTAEEFGLLGSAYYAANPLYPTRQAVAGVNMDAMNVLGRTHDVVVVGYGSSELEGLLAEAAADQGRHLVPEPTPEKGYFYRSDHFSFAKRGVPVLYAEGGQDLRDHGKAYGAAAAEDYVANRYHKPADEFDPSWDLSGAVEDMALYFRVGFAVADSDLWPAWNDGNEFKAIRERDLAQ